MFLYWIDKKQSFNEYSPIGPSKRTEENWVCANLNVKVQVTIVNLWNWTHRSIVISVQYIVNNSMEY